MAKIGVLVQDSKFKIQKFKITLTAKAAIKREKNDACISSSEREQARTKFNL